MAVGEVVEASTSLPCHFRRHTSPGVACIFFGLLGNFREVFPIIPWKFPGKLPTNRTPSGNRVKFSNPARTSLEAWWSLINHISDVEMDAVFDRTYIATGLIMAVDLYKKIQSADQGEKFRLRHACAQTNIRGWRAAPHGLPRVFTQPLQCYGLFDESKAATRPKSQPRT